MIYAALVYCHSSTPRLQYIVDFLSAYYGLSFKLITDEEIYKNADAYCKINYSFQRIEQGEVWICSHSLLFESAIYPVRTECFQQDGCKVFFKTEGDMAFDIFAATFFLLSRYEEYLPHKKDMYGRYAHENSLAYREDFLQLPLVNIWLENFRNLLLTKNAAFRNPHTKFSFVPTYDIDMAWSYRNKGFKRNAGAILQLIVNGKWRQIRERIKVLRKKSHDPFDAYNWLDGLHKKNALHPVYFFLVAQQKGKYDKNIEQGNKEFQQLLFTTAQKYKVGLHPSWASNDLASLLPQEKFFLEQTINQPVNLSRQHYIRFCLPDTFQHLIQAGLTHEYSMGYGSINGFRASVATPFFWYNLQNEEQTNLLIHPFCFMEATSFYKHKLEATEALQELLYYYKTIKAVHGNMITIWHNSSLGSTEELKGWKEVYEQFVSTISGDVT